MFGGGDLLVGMGFCRFMGWYTTIFVFVVFAQLLCLRLPCLFTQGVSSRQALRGFLAYFLHIMYTDF